MVSFIFLVVAYSSDIMQRTVRKKTRRVGRVYRKVVKAAKLKKAHRRRMRMQRRIGRR